MHNRKSYFLIPDIRPRVRYKCIYTYMSTHTIIFKLNIAYQSPVVHGNDV